MVRRTVLPEPERADPTASAPGTVERGGREALDRGVLQRLVTDLRSEAAVSRIAQRFLDLLPERMDRLRRAVAAGEVDAALEVSLSLAVTAATLGGRALHDVMREVESRLGRRDLASASQLLPAAQQAASALATALRQALPPGLPPDQAGRGA